MECFFSSNLASAVFIDVLKNQIELKPIRYAVSTVEIGLLGCRTNGP